MVFFFFLCGKAKSGLAHYFPCSYILSCAKLEDAETETLWERATKKLPPTSEIVKGRPGGRHHT